MNKRLFSGIQPSGNLHLGNYLGAIRQWIPLQDECEAFFSVVDLHAITVPQDPAELRRKTLEIAKVYLAAGIDPSKATLFVQSHVPEHTELMWILNTVARLGDLEKMTQFKDKAGLSSLRRDKDEFIKSSVDSLNSARGENDRLYQKVEESYSKLREWLETKNSDNGASILLDLSVHEGNFRKQYTSSMQALGSIVSLFVKMEDLYKDQRETIGVGLFDYPVLMAADILLYGAAVVPVGDDQVQHVELTRTLARRFNDRFGETFVVPEPRVMKEGARIMGLDDPTKKMSKSAASEYNYIALSDDPEQARKKIMKAVTDSGTEIAYQDDKPALRNLITIYSLLDGKTPEEIVSLYAGKGYADFKRDLAEVVASFLAGFQAKMSSISDEEAMSVLRAGAEKARAVASDKMRQVRERVGFLA